MNLLISKRGIIVGDTLSLDNAKRHAIIAEKPLHVVTGLADFQKLPKKLREVTEESYGPFATWRDKSFPYCGKVAVKKVIRHMYSNGECAMTHDELLEAVPGSTWISITTAFSMLKNKRYSDGAVMKIDQVEGKYRRTK